MREMLERLLRSADVPNPERAEQLWAEYRTGGSGANKAFATLLAWYGNVLYRRIWGFVRSNAAEDVFQDVLTRLHKQRASFATFEHALNWMRTVAVALSLNAHRGEKRRRARDERATRPEAQPPGEMPGELQEMIRVGLAKLPEEYREAVALHYFEGLTKRDAAAVLGIDRDTVAKRLQEALARLRKLVPVPAVAASGGVAVLEAELAASVPLTPSRMAALIAATAPTAVAGWLVSTKAKVLAAVLALGLASVASAYYLTRSPEMPPQSSPQTVRLGVEPLEPRTVPSADLLFALGVGSAAGNSWGQDVATDAAGNSYVAGFFAGTVDFDPAGNLPGNADVLTAQGVGDAFVAKYASNGRLAWARRMGGSVDTRSGYSDRANSVAVDAAGNVYAAGYFQGTADFGPLSRTSAGGMDAYVVKLSSAGAVQWATRWGGANADNAEDIGVDAAGYVYAGGSSIPTSSSGSTHVVTRLKPNGAIDWQKTISPQASYTLSLTVDAAGNTYLAGSFQGVVDFNPGTKWNEVYPVDGGASSGYLLKLTPAGKFGWVSTFAGHRVDGQTGWSVLFRDLAVDASGFVIAAGSYKGTVDFDPGAGASLRTAGRLQNGFVAKLGTATGSLAWVGTLDSADGAIDVNGVAVDAAGSVYATGFPGRAVTDFDPGPGTDARAGVVGPGGSFVWKLDAAGGYQWAKIYGGIGSQGMAVDPSGIIHLGGVYQGAVDLDPAAAFELPDYSNSQYSNICLVKLSQN